MEYMELIGEKTNATAIHGASIIEKSAAFTHSSPSAIANIHGAKIDMNNIGKQESFQSNEYAFNATICSDPLCLAVLALCRKICPNAWPTNMEGTCSSITAIEYKPVTSVEKQADKKSCGI